jgi:hypothetical protein
MIMVELDANVCVMEQKKSFNLKITDENMNVPVCVMSQ